VRNDWFALSLYPKVSATTIENEFIISTNFKNYSTNETKKHFGNHNGVIALYVMCFHLLRFQSKSNTQKRLGNHGSVDI